MRQKAILAQCLTGGIPPGAVSVLTWETEKNAEVLEKDHKTDSRVGQKALV